MSDDSIIGMFFKEKCSIPNFANILKIKNKFVINEKIPNKLSPKNLAIIIFCNNNNTVPIPVSIKENIL